MTKCPICDREASEEEINRHLDQGCETVVKKLARRAEGTPSSKGGFSFVKKRPNTSSQEEATTPTSIKSSAKRLKSDAQEEHVSNVVVDLEDSDGDRDKTAKSSPSSNTFELFSRPLAELVRPTSLEEYVGQDDIVGKDGILRKFLENDTCPSLILWGPSGVGKTTFARILASATKSRFVELSATSHSVADCKKVFDQAKKDKFMLRRNTIIFLDEIHRFNRAQQDIFCK